MVHLSFYAIISIIYDVMNDINTMYNTLGYPVIIISKVTHTSCNGRRNVLLNNYIIDKFVDTKMALHILGYWVGIHTQIFNCIFCIQSNLELTFLHVAVFVKIPFQPINYPYMLRVCRPIFMKFKDR